jgi:hypothetical protein
MKKEYLGDGVYAEIDLDRVRLTTENGYQTINVIYLELEVFEMLYQYVNKFTQVRA